MTYELMVLSLNAAYAVSPQILRQALQYLAIDALASFLANGAQSAGRQTILTVKQNVDQLSSAASNAISLRDHAIKGKSGDAYEQSVRDWITQLKGLEG